MAHWPTAAFGRQVLTKFERHDDGGGIVYSVYRFFHRRFLSDVILAFVKF